MSIYIRGDFYYARAQIRGTEHRTSTGTSDKREARAFERRWKADLRAAPSHATPATPLTLANLEALDIARAMGRSSHPGAQLESTLGTLWARVHEALGDVDARLVTVASMQAIVSHCRGRGMRSQSIRRVTAALARGLKLAGLPVPPVPTLTADAPKASQAGRGLPVAELKRFVLALESPYADLATFAALTGLRSEELARCSLAWVSQDGALLTLPAEATKTRRARTIGLAPEALAILQRHGSLAALVNTHRGPFARAAKAADIAPVSLRTLRHWHATEALRSTGDLAGTAAALGHSLAILPRYQHADTARAVAASAAVAGVLSR